MTDAMTSTVDGRGTASGRRRWARALCLAAGFTTLVDQSILNVAAPALRGALHAGTAELQWILAGYSLTFGLALVPAGRLGDAHGRRYLFAGGLAVFTLASVVAGTASDAAVVAVARLVQGLGAGTVNPQVLGIIQDLFTGRERMRALGAYATVAGLAGVIGPVIGGVVLSVLGEGTGWRVVLLVNVPFGLVTVPLALRYLPAGPRAAVRRSLDLPGLALLAALILLVLLPLVGFAPLFLVAAALPTAVLFLHWERRYARTGRTPVLVPALIASRGFVRGTLVAMFQFGASLAVALTLMLLLQDGLGYGPLAAALVVLPSAAAFGITSSVSWRVVTRYGPAVITWALAGSAVVAGATVLCALYLPVRHLAIGFTVTQVLMGIAGGLVLSPNQALTLAHAPAGDAGLAGALHQLSQRVSSTIGIAAVTGVVLAGAADGSYRAGAARGLALCLAMVLASVVVAARRGDTVRP
jgi:MFS family permease